MGFHPRVPCQPTFDAHMFVRAVIVHHQVQFHFFRILGVQSFEEF